MTSKFAVLPAMVLAASLSGCGERPESVQVTLCKSLAEKLLAASGNVQWHQVDIVPRRPEYADVKLAFERTDAQGGSYRASCRYDYDAVEDTAMEHSDPFADYATLPTEVYLNDQLVPYRLVEEKIREYQMGLGKAVVERVEQGVDDAVTRVRTELGQ